MSERETDLTRAFQRLIEDEEFLDRVLTDPDDALAGYDLSRDEVAAISADAAALEGDVAGFGRFTLDQAMLIGGLRSPGLIRPTWDLSSPAILSTT